MLSSQVGKSNQLWPCPDGGSGDQIQLLPFFALIVVQPIATLAVTDPPSVAIHYFGSYIITGRYLSLTVRDVKYIIE